MFLMRSLETGCYFTINIQWLKYELTWEARRRIHLEDYIIDEQSPLLSLTVTEQVSEKSPELRIGFARTRRLNYSLRISFHILRKFPPTTIAI